MKEPLRLRTEIESLCRKAGVEPRDVSYIAVSPMNLVIFHHDRPVRADENGGPVEHTLVVPYVWESDGDPEEV